MCRLPVKLYLGCGCSIPLAGCQICSNCHEGCFSYIHVELNDGLCPTATAAIHSGTELGSCQLGCMIPEDCELRLARLRRAATQTHWSSWDKLGLEPLFDDEENSLYRHRGGHGGFPAALLYGYVPGNVRESRIRPITAVYVAAVLCLYLCIYV